MSNHIMSKKRTAVLISGRGSNMQALVKATRENNLAAEIALVLSNEPQAAGLSFAASHSIPTLALDHRAYPDRTAFDVAIHQALMLREIELVCLAGFMRLLTPEFVARWEGRMINIHPALLPSFKGLNTHARALEAGVKLHGCTVHFVTAGMDEGPIIAQAAVPVRDDDTPTTLGARVLAEEHKIFPQALDALARGVLRVEGMRVLGMGGV